MACSGAALVLSKMTRSEEPLLVWLHRAVVKL